MQTTITPAQPATGLSATKLAECFRGELSAVETYEHALKHIDHVDIHQALQDILVSHSRRVELIRDRMLRAGMEVPAGSGLWGAFAKAVQAGADMLSMRTAISALEAGEDDGIRLYTKDLEGCDPETRNFISGSLLPEQQRTHELCRKLQKYLKQPS